MTKKQGILFVIDMVYALDHNMCQANRAWNCFYLWNVVDWTTQQYKFDSNRAIQCGVEGAAAKENRDDSWVCCCTLSN
jgi:hypothetical protein